MVVYGGGCICICNANCNKWDEGHECVCEGVVVMHRRAEEDNSRDGGQAKSVGQDEAAERMGSDLVRLEVGEVGVEHRAFRCRDINV